MVDDSLVREAILDIQPYVPGKPIGEVKRELGLEKVIKLASNENPLGPAPEVIETMQEAVKGVSIYPDGYAFKLRQRLSQKLGVDEEQLIFGNGSDELLAMLAQAFLTAGEEVIMGGTTFSEYRFAGNLMGAKVTPIPLADYRHDLTAMAEAISEATKMVFVCNPNNPTGTIVAKEEVEQFLEQVPEDVLVVFDEAYYEYVTSEQYPETINYLADYDNVIILRTFSKAYGLAGLRIGYGIASPQIIDYWSRVKQPFNVDAVAQKAALAALEAEEHLTKTLAYNNQGKEYFYQQFEEMGLEYVPTESNFIMVDVARDNEEVFEEMMEQGIIIRSLDSFGYDSKIRVTVGLPEENQACIQALKRVLNL